MLEAILTQRKVTTKVKVTVKSLVAVGLVVLAIVLPQIVHLTLGASGGIMLMSMYFPVLIGGCLLGTTWGLAVGAMSPVLSFLFTSAIGEAMPQLARLPFMVVELMVFAAVSGMFSKAISKNKWLAFPAVLFSAVAGRASFVALVAIFDSVSVLSVGMVWSQVLNGLLGLLIQAVIVPLIVIAISKLIKKEESAE